MRSVVVVRRARRLSVGKTVCAKCGGERDGSNTAYCRVCYNAYKRDWYQRNRESENARCAAYTKANPHVARESMRRYRARHPERASANFRRWRAENKDRVALYDHTKRAKRRAAIKCDRVTLAEWNEIKARYRNCCAYCGMRFARLTMDHVIPLSKGGRHIAENIAPACRLCNGRKTNMLPIEFAQQKLGRLL